VNRSTPLSRLFRYAMPYRTRITWAVVGMLLYGAGAAGLAWLIKPILDQTLSNQQRLTFTAWGVVGMYLLKGVGSYPRT
jgi:ABC-type multidrug transport system fused ATPase/permease subunit